MLVLYNYWTFLLLAFYLLIDSIKLNNDLEKVNQMLICHQVVHVIYMIKEKITLVFPKTGLNDTHSFIVLCFCRQENHYMILICGYRRKEWTSLRCFCKHKLIWFWNCLYHHSIHQYKVCSLTSHSGFSFLFSCLILCLLFLHLSLGCYLLQKWLF